MVLRTSLITAFVLLASAANAEPVKLSGAEIRAALSGKTVLGNQNGREWRQVFFKGGSTDYTQSGGAPSQGRWRVEGDQYCSVWPPSDVWACYDMAMDGDDILFIESGGTEWRARFVDR